MSALAGTAGETSSDEILVEQIAAGSKPAIVTLAEMAGIAPIFVVVPDVDTARQDAPRG